MLFRRLILAAVGIGVVVGLLLGIGEQFTTAPLIHAAEQFETAPPQAHSHGADAAADHHHHDHASAWAPADGFQRGFFTLVASIGQAIGFAVVLMVAMSVARLVHGASLRATTGLAWGGLGFLAVFAAPSLGLPPELPGMAAAPLAPRQSWWVGTVFVVGAAFWIACFVPRRYKWAALLLLPLPYIFGAPWSDGSRLAGHDAAAAQTLAALHQRFIVTTTVVNLVFWLVLGTACAWAMRRWVIELIDEDPHETDSRAAAPR